MKLKSFLNNIRLRAKDLGASNTIYKNKKKSDNKQEEKTEMNLCEDSVGLFQKDGMSTATARFIIERDVGEKIGEIFDVKDLTNTGRYYIAKIVRPDGSVIEQLLVDKQNCKVHFPRANYG